MASFEKTLHRLNARQWLASFIRLPPSGEEGSEGVALPPFLADYVPEGQTTYQEGADLSSVLLDNSANNHHMTQTHGTAFIAGPVNAGRYGISMWADSFTFPLALRLAEFSMYFAVRWNAALDLQALLYSESQTTDVAVLLGRDNSTAGKEGWIRFTFTTTASAVEHTLEGGASIPDFKLMVVSIHVRDGRQELWVDGVMVASADESGLIDYDNASSAHYFAHMLASSAQANSMQGRLYRHAVSNSFHSSQEIEAVHAEFGKRFNFDSTFHYDFEDLARITVFDGSGLMPTITHEVSSVFGDQNFVSIHPTVAAGEVKFFHPEVALNAAVQITARWPAFQTTSNAIMVGMRYQDADNYIQVAFRRYSITIDEYVGGDKRTIIERPGLAEQTEEVTYVLEIACNGAFVQARLLDELRNEMVRAAGVTTILSAGNLIFGLHGQNTPNYRIWFDDLVVIGGAPEVPSYSETVDYGFDGIGPDQLTRVQGGGPVTQVDVPAQFGGAGKAIKFQGFSEAWSRFIHWPTRFTTGHMKLTGWQGLAGGVVGHPDYRQRWYYGKYIDADNYLIVVHRESNVDVYFVIDGVATNATTPRSFAQFIYEDEMADMWNMQSVWLEVTFEATQILFWQKRNGYHVMNYGVFNLPAELQAEGHPVFGAMVRGSEDYYHYLQRLEVTSIPVVTAPPNISFDDAASLANVTVWRGGGFSLGDDADTAYVGNGAVGISWNDSMFMAKYDFYSLENGTARANVGWGKRLNWHQRFYLLGRIQNYNTYVWIDVWPDSGSGKRLIINETIDGVTTELANEYLAGNLAWNVNYHVYMTLSGTNVSAEVRAADDTTVIQSAAGTTTLTGVGEWGFGANQANNTFEKVFFDNWVVTPA